MCRFLSRQRRRGDWAEANQAMEAAAQTLETVLDTFTTGEAGILVRPSPDQTAAQANAEIQRALFGFSPPSAKRRADLDDSETPPPAAPDANAEIERAPSELSPQIAKWRAVLDDSESPHPWVIVSAEGLTELAASTRAVGEALARAGLGPRLLAVAYPFRWNDRKIYWIYQPRIRAFTPFAPAEHDKKERDHALELRMEKASRPDLPTSSDIKEWYPVWGMPI